MSFMPERVLGNEAVGPELVRQAADTFIRNQVSQFTQKAYRFDLEKWFSWLGDLSKHPTVQDALDFRLFLEQNYKSRSAARIFNTCRAFYRFCGGFNPFQAVKSPKTVTHATPEVPDDLLVMKMMELVDNPRDRLVLALLLNGLRRSEVVSLTEESIQWSPTYGCDIIRVIGKGNKERLVPATLDTSLAYREYEGANGWLFPGSKGGQITARTVEYISERWSEAAGKKTSPHKFRHHYATRLVRAGAPVLSLSQMMGHASVATTQVYVKLDLSTIIDAAAMDPMNRKVVEA